LIIAGERNDGDIRHLLGELGMDTYYIYASAQSGPNPSGLNRVRLIQVGPNLNSIGDDALRSLAASNRGNAWMIGNEPNVPGQDLVSGDDYAQQFNRLQRLIKEGDSTATIVGPNVLNWDFTCSGCGGYTSGKAWVDGFRSSYRNRYGSEPPIDVWGIHAYDIDWTSLPMTHSARAQSDLRAFSAYLQAIPAHASKPIWVTEYGVIWGYPGVEAVPGTTAVRPTGSFATAAVDGYIGEMTNWLRVNGPGLRIGRAFVFASFSSPERYTEVATQSAMFDGPGTGARLTSTGRAFLAAANGP
jgi:hypothetical protein